MSLWGFEGVRALAFAHSRQRRLEAGQHGASARSRKPASLTISAVIATGVHLFPFRTEKLSPPAPMVLGAQAPGRVGRRRINSRGLRKGPSSFFERFTANPARPLPKPATVRTMKTLIPSITLVAAAVLAGHTLAARQNLT